MLTGDRGDFQLMLGKATTVAQYLAALPAHRRLASEAVRKGDPQERRPVCWGATAGAYPQLTALYSLVKLMVTLSIWPVKRKWSFAL